MMVVKDYITQMRAAGFPDELIKKKLLATKSINVPDTLPENFGSSNWAGGLMGELQKDVYEKGNWVNTVPNPNNYMEYMQGGTVNRVPTYQEFSSRSLPKGKFRTNQSTNLMTGFQKRLEGYQGPTISPSQQSYEMGIVGLPQELANQWIPQYLELAQNKADEAREREEYESNVVNYAQYGIDVKPGDTAEDIARKIIDYNESARESEIEATQQSGLEAASENEIKAAQDLRDDWIKAKNNYTSLFEPINYKDENGEEKTVDPLDLIIEFIRQGQSIEKISSLINIYKLPITNQELKGLYQLYAQ